MDGMGVWSDLVPLLDDGFGAAKGQQALVAVMCITHPLSQLVP